MITTHRAEAAGKAARDAAAMEQRWAEAREWMGEVDFAVYDRVDELLEEPDPRVIGLAIRSDGQLAHDLRYLAALAWDQIKLSVLDQQVGFAADAGEGSDA